MNYQANNEYTSRQMDKGFEQTIHTQKEMKITNTHF